ncbi:MAG: hypothetical protein WBF06_08375 [Candidatus Acidiferrales bacterium]
MKLRAKLIFSVGLLGLLCVMLPGSLRADTTYTYTGQDYNTCGGTYCSGGPYALSITFDTTLTVAQLESQTGDDITADISSFSFTDGSANDIILPGNETSYDFDITTNSSGDIEAYSIVGLITPLGETGQFYEDFASFSTATGQEDFSQNYAEISDVEQGITNYGLNESYTASGYATLGSWSAPATTGEPSMPLLLGIGLMSLVALAARRKHIARPIPH